MTKTKIKSDEAIKLEIENILTLIHPQFCAALEVNNKEEADSVLALTRILRIFVKYLLYDQECMKREMQFMSKLILENRGDKS